MSNTREESLLGRPVLFWTGVIAILAGVFTHAPMFVHAAAMNYQMHGMPMDTLMIAGMVAIVLGIAMSFVALMPSSSGLPEPNKHRLELHAIDEAPLGTEHWKLITVLTIAVVIDVMKPATLGFVVPGMAKEYGLSREAVALFPVSALTGTAVGSVLWGVLADQVGRRATVLLSGLIFIGTSICGAMPEFGWNVGMCFLMGLSAGGLLPIAFTLLAETVPARHRGWSMVLVGTVGTTGGYLLASSNAALLEPLFGWRPLWLAGIPTGLALIALNRYIPESARFLWSRGRLAEARKLLTRYGVVVVDRPADGPIEVAPARTSWAGVFKRPYTGLTIGLTFCGLAWGFVNFGFLLWLPANLRQVGLDVAASNTVLTKSALLAFPATLVVAWLYHAWSSKKTLVLFAVLMALSLAGFVVFGATDGWLLTLLIVTLLVGTAGVIAVLLPYSAEIYPLAVRATGAGIVAGSSKFGGIIGVAIGIASLISGLTVSAALSAAPIAAAGLVIALYAVETRGQYLENIWATVAKRGSDR